MHKNQWSVGIRTFTFGAVLPLAVYGVAAAQGTTGSIAGTVTDPTGAPIPGATVSITKVDTNAVHRVTTSEIGSYRVPQLPPGKYQLQVSAPGFEGFKQMGLVLLIDQVDTIDAQLTVGAATDSVNVTSTQNSVIQTETSSIGTVVDQQAIVNTPLNGRLSIVGLMALAPGVQNSGAQDQLATRGVTAAVGSGARNGYGGMGSTLDGVTNQEVTLQRGEGEVPPLGAIAEFKVLTSGAPAEFNQPSQIIVVSSSGTNKLHGKVLEYNRSKGLGAKSYFSGSLPRPPYQRNEYGGHVTGPIVIPHVYNGHDRSFFSFAFEGFNLNQAFADNTIQPTLLERQGNFTEFLPGGICATSPAGTVITNPAFTGNIINQPINPVSLKLLNTLYPKPTKAGCGVNTIEEVSETSKSTRYFVRLDHKIDEKNQLRFTFLRAFYGPNPTNGTDSLQGGNSQDGEHNSNFIVGYTHTFTPTVVMDINASYFHLPIYRTPQNYNVDFSSIIPGLGPELIEGAPQITIAGGPQTITPVSESGSHDLEQDMQFNTSVTKVFAKHTVKAGFSYLYNNHWNDSAIGPQRGAYNFSTQYTGIAFADFLLGAPTTTQLSTPNNYIVRNLSSQYGLYVQDDWKLRPNLTINAGLRYDLQWFFDNPYGNDSLYIPSVQKVVIFSKTVPSSALTNFLPLTTLAANVGLPDKLFSYLGQDKKNFAPRLGFSYEPIHNYVVRGAFGIYFNLLPSSYVDGASFGNLPFTSNQTFTNSTTGTPAFTMSNPFGGTGAFTANPNVSAQPKLTTPYTEEYNLAVEHQFAKGVDVRIGYVGQHNLKQNNYGGPGTTSPNSNLLSTPVVGVKAQATNLVQPFAAISNLFDPIFHSSENALQVGVHKLYSNGFAFGAEYSWTRVLGTENIEDPSGAHPNDSYGPISGITPQVLTVNYSYLLPIGRGKKFLGTSSKFVDEIVGGWEVSGITAFQTGQPFSVTYSAPGSPSGQVSGRASVVPGMPLYPKVKTKAQWFNPQAFQAPVCYNANGTGACSGSNSIYSTTGPTTYATYGNSGYNMLRGPGYQNWDINLQKSFKFTEACNLQLRADSFNVFNHGNLSTPNASILTTSVGQITSPATTPFYEPRTVEFAAKLSF